MSKPKLLADENIPRMAVVKLRELGYSILSVYKTRPGLSDDEVIETAIKESRIIITYHTYYNNIW